MSSTVSQRHEPTPKQWWPQKPAKLSKFNSIATAIGLKSKKPPSLAIEHPPPIVVAPSLKPAYTNRPPSKSVSSSLSRGDSIGPRTPRDDPNRHSLLTLSDTDPFAGRGIVTPIPSDSRLSAYSNSSDPSSKRQTDPPPPYRGSYGSSSSQHYPSDLSPTVYSPVSPFSDFSQPRKLASKRSTGSLHKPTSIEAAWDSLVVPVPPSGFLSKSDSSVTLTEKFQPNKTTSLIHSASTGAPRPAMRPRGMTESNIQRPPKVTKPSNTDPKLVSRPSTSSHASPRVIVRQPSSSRLVQPPKAPPTQQLPPPPTLEPFPDLNDPKSSNERLFRSSAGSSSSTLSFASSVSSAKDLYISSPTFSPRRREKLPAAQPYPPSESPRSPTVKPLSIKCKTSSSHSHRTLKKAVSHQTLGKRNTPPSNPIPPSPESTPEKGPRKQRSFHHHRIPIPPIPLPLRHTNSSGSQSSIPPLPDSAALPDPRRATPPNPPLTRKRLWSGSSGRRPATSNGVVSEDDSLSIFSLRSEFEAALPRSIVSGRQQPSFWDDPALDPPASPSASTSEYTPQQIMSAAEIAQVVEESNHRVRPRGMSMMSTSTVTSLAVTSEEGVSPPSVSFSSVTPFDLPRPQTAPMRTSTTSSIRPSRASIGSVAPSIAPSSASPPNSYVSPIPIPVLGLPPPPRARGKLHTFEAPVPSVSSWRVEEKKNPSLINRSAHSTVAYAGFNNDQPMPLALAPAPIRRPVKPKITMERVILRQSIMKKPSFLEIDDDTDRETDVESPTMHHFPTINTSSFLDLARESFDSVRTVD